MKARRHVRLGEKGNIQNVQFWGSRNRVENHWLKTMLF